MANRTGDTGFLADMEATAAEIHSDAAQAPLVRVDSDI